MSRLSKESSSHSVASTSQEGQEEDAAGLASNRTLRVTLLSSEWKSSKGGLSTINRELAIQLAKQPNVEVSVYVPQCSEEDKEASRSHNVQLIEAEKLSGHEPVDWLAFVPEKHSMDCIIGHGVHLGRQIPLIKRQHPHCKWIQVVHTAPEELGMFKCYADAISKGEKKHQVEVELCEKAEEVVAVGPKLADAYSRYLRYCQKDQDVLTLTPSIFTEFSEVKQATEERNAFYILLFGRGDSEDFELKGYDIAAQAVAELKDQEKSHHLMFIGAPSGKEEEVKEKLLQHGISRSQLTVRSFNESREWLAKLLCEADLAIMPSRTEGFGLTALEALSAGLPILVSGNSGLGEALRKVPHGSNCIVDSEDPKDWAKAITAVCKKDREIRLVEAKDLREKYSEKYSWQESCSILVEKMLNLHFGSSESNSAALEKGKRPSTQVSTQTTHGHLEGKTCDCPLAMKILEDEYNRRSNLKPLLWYSSIHLPLEQVYTRLEIKSRKKPFFRLTNEEVHMYDIFKPEKVNYGNKIDPRTGKPVEIRPKVVLVEGSPGIGKTTFCIKVANDWVNKTIPVEHDFPPFQLVLLLKCCDIDGDVLHAIDDQLIPEDMTDKKKKDLMDYIRNNENHDKILLILDGLDELPKEAEEQVDKLLKRKIFSSCFILVTSRQERGIQVRQNYDFDVLLQINGFTENDASKYIRKHFKIVDCESSSIIGERLIRAIEKNTFLHALPSNPLNLLLLCIVFEEYEGELPSSRTELYQIITQFLLGRFCAKHDLDIPSDDKPLEKQFEDSLLALGELAWKCLQEDLLYFLENELTRFESVNEDLVVRILGLVFKEASVKKIKAQHEYHFFHKTFQEYLAAYYLAYKIIKEQLDVFRDFELDFDVHVVNKYRQVFLFVSGILGKDACVLFAQIGKVLKTKDWDWLKCSDEEATFFTESFSESRNAEHVATTLCSFIPFPLTVDIDARKKPVILNILNIANTCANFPQLQHPVHLTVSNVFGVRHDEVPTIVDFLTTCPKLETLCLSFFASISPDVAVGIGKGLAANKTLNTVTFKLIDEWSDAWATALEESLSSDTPLQSVVLKIYGSMSDTAIQALKKVLSNTSLTSLDLIIYGDMIDFQATAVGEGLAAATNLKSLTLTVYGKLSYSGTISLNTGFLHNTSLKFLKVTVFGELPDNWVTTVENVLVAQKYLMSVTIHPNIIGNINAQVGCLFPYLESNCSNFKQSLILNLWGKLSCDVAKALAKFLKESSNSCVTLNVRGRVTDDAVDCLLSNLKKCKTLPRLTINIWQELTRGGNSALQESSCSQTYPFDLNLRGVSSDNSSSNTSKSKLSLYISNHRGMNEDLACSLSDSLTTSTSLTTLSLTVNSYGGMSGDWARDLGDGLAKSTLLTTLNLTVNGYSDCYKFIIGDWGRHLGDGLVKNASLTALTLTLNNCNVMDKDWEHGLGCGLAENMSLTSLSLTFNNCLYIGVDQEHGLGNGLAENTSLTTLSLTFNNSNVLSADWVRDLDHGLAKNTSLTTLSLALNSRNDISVSWRPGLGDGLARNTTLTTLYLTYNSYSDRSESWARGLAVGLANNVSLTTLNLTYNNYSATSVVRMHYLLNILTKNTSLTTLSLSVNSYSSVSGDWGHRLGDGLAKNTSLTTLILMVNSYRCMSRDWVHGLGDGLSKNASLATLTLTVNGYSDMNEDWEHGLGDGLANNASLATLNLTFNNYRGMGGNWGRDLGDGLAKNTSLTALCLVFNNYGDMSEGWGCGLGNGLEKNTSLTTLSLTLSNYGGMSGDWGRGLGDGFAKNTSLNTLFLTFNNYSDMGGDWGRGLGDGLAKNTSLTMFSLTFNNYSCTSGDWLKNLCDSLAKSDTKANLSFTINNHSSSTKLFGTDLSKHLSECKSISSFNLTVSLYGEDSACVLKL